MLNATHLTLIVSTDSSALIAGAVGELLAAAGWAYGPGDFDVAASACSRDVYTVDFLVDGRHSMKSVVLFFKSLVVDGVAVVDAWVN